MHVGPRPSGAVDDQHLGITQVLRGFQTRDPVDVFNCGVSLDAQVGYDFGDLRGAEFRAGTHQRCRGVGRELPIDHPEVGVIHASHPITIHGGPGRLRGKQNLLCAQPLAFLAAAAARQETGSGIEHALVRAQCSVVRAHQEREGQGTSVLGDGDAAEARNIHECPGLCAHHAAC